MPMNASLQPIAYKGIEKWSDSYYWCRDPLPCVVTFHPTLKASVTKEITIKSIKMITKQLGFYSPEYVNK